MIFRPNSKNTTASIYRPAGYPVFAVLDHIDAALDTREKMTPSKELEHDRPNRRCEFLNDQVQTGRSYIWTPCSKATCICFMEYEVGRLIILLYDRRRPLRTRRKGTRDRRQAGFMTTAGRTRNASWTNKRKSRMRWASTSTTRVKALAADAYQDSF
ncbi:MAG: hypothetical protein MZU97_21880 [Bacillus subtilis]|nr:hypothetical protein [Bacillus subtilis]